MGMSKNVSLETFINKGFETFLFLELLKTLAPADPLALISVLFVLSYIIFSNSLNLDGSNLIFFILVSNCVGLFLKEFEKIPTSINKAFKFFTN